MKYKTPGLLDSSVKTQHIEDGAVTGAKQSTTIINEGTQDIAAGAAWLPSAGFWVFSGALDSVIFSAYINSAWRDGTQGSLAGYHYCDGSNMRILNNYAGVRTVYYLNR